jgi:LCP family protein required for cell wall assembly
MSDSSDSGGNPIFDHRDDDAAPEDAQPTPPKRRGHGRRNVLLGFLTLILVLVLGTGAGAYYLNSRLDKNVSRIPDAFAKVPASTRPTKVAVAAGKAEPIDILLGGSDLRSSDQTTGKDASASKAWEASGQRTDAIMLIHIAGDRKTIDVMSIPRDSWVSIPGHGKNKINAAYSFGGPSLYIQTIEQVTGVRIDHLAFIDWDGFKALTDAVGGIDLTFDKTVKGASGTTFGPGKVHLNGTQALDYVRERKSLPGGDFDRQKRQQNFLRAVMSKTLSQGTLSNPIRLTKALDAATNNLSVDDQFTTSQMRDLALSLRSIRSSNVTFLSVPNGGTGTEGGQSVVYLDTRRCALLFAAVKKDQMPAYLAEYGGDTLGTKVN